MTFTHDHSTDVVDDQEYLLEVQVIAGPNHGNRPDIFFSNMRLLLTFV